MALEDIRGKIFEDARIMKEDLLNRAEEKKQGILNEFKLKIEEYKHNILDSAKTEGENIKKGIVIDAKLKYRNDILAKKRSIMDNIIKNAVIDFISSFEYKSVMESSAVKYSETKSEEIIISANEKTLDKNWIDSINKKHKTDFRFSGEKGNFTGGIILKNGDKFINLTVDMLINHSRPVMEKELLHLLF